MPTEPVSVAQIGYGYWGPNLARNLAKHPGIRLVAICDVNAGNRDRAAADHADVAVCADASALISDPAIDAIVVATPAGSHATLCGRALAAGKHVLVTKPVATTVADAEMLAQAAERHRRVLLVDHTFLYTPAVAHLKEILAAGRLGRPLYYDSVRTGLGIFKNDVNIVDDLAVHDLAIIEHLFPAMPAAVSAVAAASFPGLRESLCYITLRYADGLLVHLASHWLSPLKQRQVVLAGTDRMLVWDDSRPDERIRIFDSGITPGVPSPIPGRADVAYRNGEVEVPALAQTEALAAEVEDFVRCIRHGARPRADGAAALRVMRMVGAVHRSAALNGAPVGIDA